MVTPPEALLSRTVVTVTGTMGQFRVTAPPLANVTAAVLDMTRPFTVAPVPKAIVVPARILPVNSELVPRATEVLTSHQTLHGSPPTTLELAR